MDGQMDGQTDDQHETIIPRQYHVAGYKKVYYLELCLFQAIFIKFLHLIHHHYENTPIQMYWKFYDQKRKIFR